MSLTPQSLLQKVKEMYPEIERYKLKASVSFDEAKDAWILKLVKDSHELVTHIERMDAEKCMEGVECVYLTHQVGQFIRVYCEDGDSCTR
ncbi:dissimilatory siroheme-sulfite reductase, gamma subunit-like protein [Desulfovibrio sp. X2]|uniref:hypothetical protein n=1 Tax=Desulfovibrio sp. X2 TaxID=941449 RepID=UPI000358E6B1|nr:hypothetical protein [Desulfovibrio sp. X2]EPR41184.1 dissimilatory siroheme-sulfite reductase, gamma subunit-like protein [Desulfovibrio sp. X2]